MVKYYVINITGEKIIMKLTKAPNFAQNKCLVQEQFTCGCEIGY